MSYWMWNPMSDVSSASSEMYFNPILTLCLCKFQLLVPFKPIHLFYPMSLSPSIVIGLVFLVYWTRRKAASLVSPKCSTSFNFWSHPQCSIYVLAGRWSHLLLVVFLLYSLFFSAVGIKILILRVDIFQHWCIRFGIGYMLMLISTQSICSSTCSKCTLALLDPKYLACFGYTLYSGWCIFYRVSICLSEICCWFWFIL